MQTLIPLRALLHAIWNMLYLAELIRQIVDRWPKTIPAINPDLIIEHSPVQTNMLGQSLLGAYKGEQPVAFAQFRARYILPLYEIVNSGVFADYLSALWAWTRNGRRVYRVDADLARILSTTKPPNITWRELVFPLDAFVVRLAEPWLHPYGNGAVSHLIAARFEGELANCFSHGEVTVTSLVIIMAVPDKYDDEVVHLIPEALRQLLARRASTGDKTKLPIELLKELGRYIDTVYGEINEIDARPGALSGFFLMNDALDRSIRSPFSAIVEMEALQGADLTTLDARAAFDDLIGVFVANLVTYLGMARPDRPQTVSQPTPPRTGQPLRGEITSDVQLLDVVHSFTLTPEERRVMDMIIRGEGHLVGRELMAHFRSRHFRRPPGFGLDPLAPRTVLVNATFVRPDRLVEGTLPGGSTVRVKH